MRNDSGGKAWNTVESNTSGPLAKIGVVQDP
jgi:hypothetical protein